MDNAKTLNSDAAVVQAVLAGSNEDFAKLVDRYHAPLVHVARSRLGRLDLAEEVVQETLLCAYRWLHSYDSHFSFRTWLWTILLNQCKRCYQKQTRRPQVVSWSDHSNDSEGTGFGEEFGLPCREVSPEASLLFKERHQLLEALLARIPQNQADALRLRFFGGLKFQEIADAMGCSLSSAKNRVRWGLTKMSDMISDKVRP